MGGIGTPDVPVAIHDRIVGAGQPLAIHFRHQSLVLAGGGIKPLKRTLFPVIDPKVRDENTALGVHINTVGGPALWSQPLEGPVREDFGDGALVVASEDSPLLGHHHVFGAVYANRDLGEGLCWDGA